MSEVKFRRNLIARLVPALAAKALHRDEILALGKDVEAIEVDSLRVEARRQQGYAMESMGQINKAAIVIAQDTIEMMDEHNGRFDD